MPWRVVDESLLRRLEDEDVVERLVSFEITQHVGGRVALSPVAVALPPRAGRLVGLLRSLPRGAATVDAALDGDIAGLAAFVAAQKPTALPCELVHHLALFHRRLAMELEVPSPEHAANAWVRSLSAWCALDVEGTYLAELGELVVGSTKTTLESSALEALAEIGERARTAATTLAPRGRAALLALVRIEEALASAPPALAARLRGEATKLRNAATEAALAPIADAYDEAGARGDLPKAAPLILHRTLSVWQWAFRDESAEHFIVDRVATVGWDAYRSRDWQLLLSMLQPLRPMFESLAERIERDPANVAYAASAAQMFVFLAGAVDSRSEKLALGERSVRICPTHRNGRLVLAAALCEDVIEEMNAIIVVVSKERIERIEKKIERAASLFPETGDLPEARAILGRLKSRCMIV